MRNCFFFIGDGYVCAGDVQYLEALKGMADILRIDFKRYVNGLYADTLKHPGKHER